MDAINADLIPALIAARWPKGFTCPQCGHQGGWRIEAAMPSYQCQRCSVQTSITAGTLMHATKLDVAIWQAAALLIIQRQGRIGAKELQEALSLTSYRTARRLRDVLVTAWRGAGAGIITPEWLVTRPQGFPMAHTQRTATAARPVARRA